MRHCIAELIAKTVENEGAEELRLVHPLADPHAHTDDTACDPGNLALVTLVHRREQAWQLFVQRHAGFPDQARRWSGSPAARRPAWSR